MAWELIFMLLLLKIPLVYLCCVVWWAIKAEPRIDEAPGDLAPVREPLAPRPRSNDRDRRARRTPLRPARRPTGPRAPLARRSGVGR